MEFRLLHHIQTPRELQENDFSRLIQFPACFQSLSPSAESADHETSESKVQATSYRILPFAKKDHNANRVPSQPVKRTLFAVDEPARKSDGAQINDEYEKMFSDAWNAVTEAEKGKISLSPMKFVLI